MRHSKNMHAVAVFYNHIIYGGIIILFFSALIESANVL